MNDIRPGEAGELHVGWHELHADVSLNFQLNRWAAYGGPRWLADVRPVLSSLVGYEAWRGTFLKLGERATSEGRTLDAALHFRSAEFFMLPSDPRKESLRRRLIPMLREAAGIDASAFVEVAFGALRLPVWRIPGGGTQGTVVVLGGFDSYIEEFFPILIRLRHEGFRVVAFEGPGQGSVRAEQDAPMTGNWHRPVAAVLDALDLHDVTLIGISLGGCLAIRAAAFEPRVRRVVAFDVLTDFFACALGQQPRAVRMLVRSLAAIGGDGGLDRVMNAAARRRPVLEWGLAQAMHVFKCDRPADALRAMQALHTRTISDRVRQDVLLLAGANDHYVPLSQLWDQSRSLSGARSITARVFTAGEQAQAHCQVGNLPLAIRTISAWSRSLDDRDASQGTADGGGSVAWIS
jgi:pimeloyl-ACP methyl ester carboxylesterase